MLTRKLTKFVVLSLSILLGTLVSDYVMKMVNKQFDKSYTTVLIGMAITLLIYYPLFSFLESYFQKITKSYVSSSKRIAKNSFQGLLIGFVLAIFVLFILFSIVWFDKSPLSDVQRMF